MAARISLHLLTAWAVAGCSADEPSPPPAPSNTTCIAPAMASAVPGRLRDSGCVDAADPRKPAAGLVPYTVRAPLWSDGAEKERHLALPPGGTIGVSDGGHLDLPVGTVLMKKFLLGGQAIETRLLVRHASGAWAGY